MTRFTTPLLIAAITVLTLGASAIESEAKACRRLCRPVVREICAEKYPGNARIQRLCRREGNKEIIPYCKAEPDPKRCI
jgi:hypothetical protein